jgi:hypothetical protein
MYIRTVKPLLRSHLVKRDAHDVRPSLGSARCAVIPPDNSMFSVLILLRLNINMAAKRAEAGDLKSLSL